MSVIYQLLGFSLEAADLLVDDQDMDTLEELSILTDDECESLCKLVRHPGGTIPNRNMAVAGSPARIPDPGLVVPMSTVTNLNLAYYYVCHLERISRVLAPVNVTLTRARNMKALRLKELAREDPTDVPLIKTTNLSKTLEQMALWVAFHQGIPKGSMA